ncbi:hypothetical protein [Kitasatospora azatica]|nr:hypothetical protein [Kitasatospora azatica]
MAPGQGEAAEDGAAAFMLPVRFQTLVDPDVLTPLIAKGVGQQGDRSG